MNWTLTITERDYESLRRHLFQDDRDEHAAFLYAGLMETEAGQRLLVRRVVSVAGADFGPSDRGAYRQVSARAVARAAIECDAEGLCLLWAHSHPGAGDAVEFSPDDLNSHAYAHPTLIDLTHARPVGGLVLGDRSVAGEIWSPENAPARIESLRVVGRHLRDLYPRPPAGAPAADERFARQVLMFGDGGQEILRRLTVAVVGAGGGGSLLVQMLAHLGVGKLIIVDYDSVSESNLSRVVGATAADVARLKVDVMRDLIARIDPTIEVDAFFGDIAYAADARRVAAADFAFLATDTILSRYAFNLLCHQYLMPGVQVGAKVSADTSGRVELVHVMERPLTLSGACLDCMGVIPADALADEQLSAEERRAQRYVDDAEDAVEDPSVITLNSISAAHAATDFLFMVTGLLDATVDLEPRVFYPQARESRDRRAAAESGCRFCDPRAEASAFARGDLSLMALKPGSRPPRPDGGSPPPDRRKRMISAWLGTLRTYVRKARRNNNE
jgi:molybdopterin/thiamine biosynthesis adenylyltransferase